MCVPWELNPQPFALLTQCSTTEPQEHLNVSMFTQIIRDPASPTEEVSIRVFSWIFANRLS